MASRGVAGGDQGGGHRGGHSCALLLRPSQLEREVDAMLRDRVNIWYKVRDYFAWLAEVDSDDSDASESESESEDEHDGENGVEANGNGSAAGANGTNGRPKRQETPRIKKVCSGPGLVAAAWRVVCWASHRSLGPLRLHRTGVDLTERHSLWLGS